MLDIPLVIGVTAQDMMASVVVFNMARSFAKWSCRRGRKNVFLYYFDRTLPGNSYKSFHSSDLWYMFGNMDRSWRPFTDEDLRLSNDMIESVVRFIREGDPGWNRAGRKNIKLRRFNTHGGKYISPIECMPELLKNTIFDRGPF